MIMPMNIGPNRRIPINVFPTFRILQPNAITRYQNKRIALLPFALTRKWMPTMLFVCCYPVIRIHTPICAEAP